MTQPRIELLPLHPATRTDAPTTLDVLVRVTPPPVEPSAARPPLNLGLVIDRSGSMGGANKIGYARDAAAFAVRELAPTDRVSVTTFDDRVETIAPSAPAEDRARVVRLIAGIEPRGGTALFDGWAEGAKQVGGNPIPGGLNRVVLLSDGLANVGESRPDAIATAVHAGRAAGVGTTTLGVGDEYNEDLLEAMARAGDGNYYYVESAAQLPAIFAAELHGLSATAGTDVTLAVEPWEGVAVADVLNDLDTTADGRFKLPNLVSGFPVTVVVRLTVPPTRGEGRVCAVRLEWAAPGGERAHAVAALSLRGVDAAAWDSLAPDPEVQEQVVLLAVARLKKKASAELDRGNGPDARRLLAEARILLASVPQTPEVGAEIQAVAELDAQVERGDYRGSSKRAKYDAYNRHHSKPYTPRSE